VVPARRERLFHTTPATAVFGITLKHLLFDTDSIGADKEKELPMVQTRKQRERQAASLTNAAYAVALIAFLFGWQRFDSLLVGFLMGLAVLGLTIVVLRLLRRRRDAALRHAGLGNLEHMNGEQFEELLQARFRAQGYRVSLTPNGADFGADLLLERDGTKTAVQAKHWRTRKVGVRVVQEVAAAKAHYRADKAAVIASGDFTEQAVQLARSNGIELWDRARLARELLNHATQAPSPADSQPAPTASPAPLRLSHGAAHGAPWALLGLLDVSPVSRHGRPLALRALLGFRGWSPVVGAAQLCTLRARCAALRRAAPRAQV